jgi:hypothetical protein
MTKIWYRSHPLWWTQSAKLTADSIEHDEKAGVIRLSRLSRLNPGPKRWPQLRDEFYGRHLTRLGSVIFSAIVILDSVRCIISTVQAVQFTH